jgi:hypothetical protein
MKRNLAVAALSIFSLVVPQFASAGQAANYPGYNPHTYNEGRYYRTAPWGNRVPVDDRHQNGQGWNHQGDDRGGSYRNGYYGDRGYYGNRYSDDRNYYERDRHAGRSTAIIGGSAVAGAVLGAAAGQGKGAAIGAIVGGVAGVVADQAVRHHDRW